MSRPVIGISADLIEHNSLTRAAAPLTYAHAIAEAGGVPIILPPLLQTATEALQRCDGLVLTGGDDPYMEPFGNTTDARVTMVKPQRQEAESAMISFLEHERPDLPVLGVCLGMQMMALHAGGRLDQFMPDTTRTHAEHWECVHAIRSLDTHVLGEGNVNSKHKQAITDPGRMRVVGVAHDGICEAIIDPARAFYFGVQWHPERTPEETLGLDLFRRLIRSARGSAH